MKRLITILAMAIFTLTLTFGFIPADAADDIPLNQEQQLILKIEQLDVTIKYAEDQIQTLKKQFEPLEVIRVRATNQRGFFQKALNDLRVEKVKKGGK